MYIRETRTKSKITGEGYYTYRLVRCERVGGKVRQITLLNLGKHFALEKDEWPLLCNRIEQLLHPQPFLFDLSCPSITIERMAQHYFSRLTTKNRKKKPDTSENKEAETDAASMIPANSSSTEKDWTEVSIDSLELTDPRSVGVEHVALQAFSQLGLMPLLKDLKISGVMQSLIIGTIIGRMAVPASERATWQWLQQRSALGELLDVDFLSMSHMSLYRASDILMQHQKAIEDQLFKNAQILFSFKETVTLYDLTNTYFEGEAEKNPKAQRGRSKEKRSDCPLLTLGLVLDGSGFVRRSRTFAGNVSEGTTLESMLTGLGADPGALVVMDAGIAIEDNLTWLKNNGYRYITVNRSKTRTFDMDDPHIKCIKTAKNEEVKLQRTFDEEGQEIFLYCHSQEREAKESAMMESFCQKFEQGLQKLADGLLRPHGEKNHDKILLRIGRLKEKSHGVSQHYTVDLIVDNESKNVTVLKWIKTLRPDTRATRPGVYCLRTNELSWDEAFFLLLLAACQKTLVFRQS